MITQEHCGIVLSDIVFTADLGDLLRISRRRNNLLSFIAGLYVFGNLLS